MLFFYFQLYHNIEKEKAQKEENNVKKNLEWYVYRENINAKSIEKYNVFSHGGFYDCVKKLPRDYETFKEQLKREAMYYFWSKCEMEVVVTSWPLYIDAEEYQRITRENEERIEKRGEPARVLNISPTVGSKIDIYDQLMLNWDAFVDYTYFSELY